MGRGLGRLLGPAALVVLTWGCNLALGIDDAELTEPEGGSAGTGGGTAASSGGRSGTGGAVAAGGSGGSQGVCTPTGEACWDCTAEACCGQYADCLDDGNCSAALQGYNECLESPPSGGSTCGEIHASKSSRFLALSQCVLLSACATPCEAYPLGNLCEPYCNCMAANCGAFIADKESCMASCPALNKEQVRCRSLHCTFASSDAALHCPHALGQSVCE